MLKKGSLVVKPGNNPDCRHYEKIVEMVGTCEYCGQVRDYRLLSRGDRKGLYAEKARKGGKKLREKSKDRAGSSSSA